MNRKGIEKMDKKWLPIILLIVAIYYFFVYVKQPTTLPPELNPPDIIPNPPIEEPKNCGNGICESDEYRKWDGRLTIYCTIDCDMCEIDPPLCDNEECEVYCGIDEFESCPNDCGTWSTTTTIQPQQPVDKFWNIKIYYIYRDYSDSQYKSKIDSAMLESNRLINEFDGSTFNWYVEPIQASVYYPSDINDMTYSKEKEIIEDLNSKTDFRNDYQNYDMTFFVFADSHGGAYSVNYMSPIWFSWSAINEKNDAIGICHEFFHPFGLKDVYPGCVSGVISQCGCIMGDLTTNTKINLCEQSSQYKLGNYKKTPIDEWL